MEPLDVTAIVNKLRAFKNINIMPQSANNDTTVQIDSSFLIASILGASIAYHLPLPSSKVVNVATYFGNSYRELLDTTLSQINEQFMIRTQLAYEACMRTYRGRYNAVYEPLTSVDEIVLRGHTTGVDSSLQTSVIAETLLSAKPEFDGLFKSINLTCASTNNYSGILI